jgi:NADPH-dependent glutamate synthase beta subunit-like oxidoreductase
MVPGTYLLLDFLVAASKSAIKPDAVGEKVVIVGGGKTAAKAANICLRKGAREVTIVFPYSEDRAEIYGIDPGEIKEPDKVKIIYSCIPLELRGEGHRISEIFIGKSPDAGVSIPLDSLIVGSGRFPEMLFVRGEENKNQWKTVEVCGVLPTERDMGIFAVGDSGRPTDLTGVVLAVRRGRKIVRAIQLYISEENIGPETGVITEENEKEQQNVREIVNPGALAFPRKNYDNRFSLSPEEAQIEANRCLSCGLLCYMKQIEVLEPTPSDRPALPGPIAEELGSK